MAENEYIVGQVIQLKDLITDPNSAPVDAPVLDATDIVTVYLPDGTTVTPAVAHSGTTPYANTAQYTPTIPGPYRYVFGSTGAGAGRGRGYFRASDP